MVGDEMNDWRCTGREEHAWPARVGLGWGLTAHVSS